jgi:hypothetical protein
MAVGVDHAVGSTADQIAEGSEKLEEDGGRMCLGVRSDGTDGEPGGAMKGCFVQFGAGRGARRWIRGRELGLLLLRFRLWGKISRPAPRCCMPEGGGARAHLMIQVC